MSATEDLQFANRETVEFFGAETLTLSREIDRLSDPSLGEPVPVEASGAHLAEAGTLTIAPQTGWSFRGSVASGTPVSVTGHSTSYATTAKATVDFASPATLALAITPGLEDALDGGEEVDLDEAGTVSYDSHRQSDRQAASRGWDVPKGSSVLVALLDGGERVPEEGDVATGAVAGTVLRAETVPSVRSVIQVGRPS